MVINQGLVTCLPKFFKSIEDALTPTRQPRDELQEMRSFFSKLHDVLPLQSSPTIPYSYTHLSDLVFLNRWIKDLSEPLAVARRSGLLCDPWKIAGLKRDEVRNSRVLAWLLDPRESHGFGDLALRSLLAELGRRSPKLELPESPHEGCRVRVESSPDGDISNRLDIEVDAPNFYLIIEVKIDAPEGEKQLLSYSGLGKARAIQRPWGILFLTPRGIGPCKKKKEVDSYKDKVVAFSWRELSSIFSLALRMQNINKSHTGTHEKMTHLLAKRFLQHVRNF